MLASHHLAADLQHDATIAIYAIELERQKYDCNEIWSRLKPCKVTYNHFVLKYNQSYCHNDVFVPSGEEPKRQPFVSMWFPGPAGLRGALSTTVLVDAHDSHSTKRLGTAGSSARKSTASAAAHHSYCTWQQPGGRRSVHRSPQHTHSNGNRHVSQRWWNRLPRADGHHDYAGQCRTRSWSFTASQSSNWLVDKMVRICLHRHVPKFRFVHHCI